MNKDEALDPINKLIKRFEETVNSLDLDIQQVVVIPARDGNPAAIQAVLIIKADAVMSEAEKEQKRMDIQFKEIERGLLEDSFDEKAKDIKKNTRDDLKDWLGYGKPE